MHETLQLVEKGLAVIGILKEDIPTLVLVLMSMIGAAATVAIYKYKLKCSKMSCETVLNTASTIESMSARLDKVIIKAEENTDDLTDTFREEVKEIQVILRSMTTEMIRMSYVHLGMVDTHKKRKDIKHEE